MNTRTKWIIFMAVVMTFSVLWPLSYMLRGHHVAEQQKNTTNGENIIHILEQYTGTITANVTAVYPQLFATGYANYGDPDSIQAEIANWTGVSQVNVSRFESNDPNYLYAFRILVNTSSWEDNERVGFWIEKKLPIRVESVFELVNISLPEKLNLTSKSGVPIQLTRPKNMKEYGYFYTKPGETQVYVYITKSGPRVEQAVALAGSQFYLPPMVNKQANVTGDILNVTKSVVIGWILYNKGNQSEINETKLSADWNATVRYIPGSKVMCPENTTIPKDLNYTIVDGYKIIKFNSTTGPDSILARLHGCFAVSGIIRVEGPQPLDELKHKVASLGVVKESYYLARVKIPGSVSINGQNVTLPSDIVSNVPVNRTEGQINIPIRISMAFGIPLGVDYAGKY